MRVLLILLQGIGNAILALPAVNYLISKGHRVDVVTSDGGFHRILEQYNGIENIYLYHEKCSFFPNIVRLKKRLEGGNYDLVYAMYPNGKRENISSYILSKSSKGCSRAGIERFLLLDFLLNKRVPIKPNTHSTIANLRLVGCADQNPGVLKAKIHIPRAIEEDANIRKLVPEGEKVIVIHPTSGSTLRCWGNEKFIELGKRLIAKKGVKIVIVGAPYEGKYLDFIVRSIGAGAAKFEHDNILYAASLIKRASLFIGNDSSLMHVSAALGKDLMAIWGFTDYKHTSPLGENSLIIRKDLPCSPCYNFLSGHFTAWYRCLRSFRCIKEIEVEDVYNIASYILENFKKGLTIKDMDFNSAEGIRVEKLWSRCKMVNLR